MLLEVEADHVACVQLSSELEEFVEALLFSLFHTRLGECANEVNVHVVVILFVVL